MYQSTFKQLLLYVGNLMKEYWITVTKPGLSKQITIVMFKNEWLQYGNDIWVRFIRI